MRIALYLGQSQAQTADAGDRTAARLERRLGHRIHRHDVDRRGTAELDRYEVLLLGCSTWAGGKLPRCWARELDRLRAVDLRGKRVALFGVGNQRLSPGTLHDALGILAELVEAAGGEIIGHWPAADYTFRRSRALRAGCFVGLALDYENQTDFNELRTVESRVVLRP